MATPAPPQTLKAIALSLGDITLKQPTTWGFPSLEGEREDLLPRHEMIIMDDKAKFDGVTSHDIRGHFTSWVFDILPDIMVTPPTESELQLTLVNHPHGKGRERDFGTRYNFCLFVDDICLESVDHMDLPAVKLLAKHFGARDPAERDYIIHPDYEDGETDNEEEDVWWMYLEVYNYVEMYDLLEETDWWYKQYQRPPLLPYDSLAHQNPGLLAQWLVSMSCNAACTPTKPTSRRTQSICQLSSR
ncbi:hypothetical protein MaudMau93_001572 [Microsporum audouinii]